MKGMKTQMDTLVTRTITHTSKSTLTTVLELIQIMKTKVSYICKDHNQYNSGGIKGIAISAIYD